MVVEVGNTEDVVQGGEYWAMGEAEIKLEAAQIVNKTTEETMTIFRQELEKNAMHLFFTFYTITTAAAGRFREGDGLKRRGWEHLQRSPRPLFQQAAASFPLLLFNAASEGRAEMSPLIRMESIKRIRTDIVSKFHKKFQKSKLLD